MKICVIGAGYVGLVAAVCYAEMGNEVISVEADLKKLEILKSGTVPIFEPGLEELLKNNIKEKRLSFTNDLKMAVKASAVCFIAVGTPQGEDGKADVSAVFAVAKEIAKEIEKYTLIVNKSTSPVGTLEEIEKIIKNTAKTEFDVASNPEFLKQGAAVEDFLRPDRVIIGTNSERAAVILKELYAPFLRNGHPIITMDPKSAEMTKYASNAFLAMKISYANFLATLCEKTGADADLVRAGMASDERIGSKFLYCGLGYGGSCFPKDVRALIGTAKDFGCKATLLEATDEINLNQRSAFVEKIVKKFGSQKSKPLEGKVFAIWGLSFKPKTNDLRDAPSIDIINSLLAKGAKVRAFDPKAIEGARSIFKDKIDYFNAPYEPLENADALLLLTEWREFRLPDFEKMFSLLKSPVIFDGRNQYDRAQLKKQGFEYYCIGKCD